MYVVWSRSIYAAARIVGETVLMRPPAGLVALVVPSSAVGRARIRVGAMRIIEISVWRRTSVDLRRWRGKKGRG